MDKQIDISLLDGLIVGRVEPYIYAFTTETVPNYLKVGDTYRPVSVRLQEWKKYFPNLEKKFENVAKIDDSTFFRDFAIHLFLESDLNKSRLLPNVLSEEIYYSKEFFKDVSDSDLISAIDDIRNNYKNNTNKYSYYKFEESRVPLDYTYERKADYPLRPNQQETVNKFKDAVINKGRKNLLMYAVMRFGKSFTSMCCAVEIGAKFIIVVSAKADVKNEWKKTVESHVKFEGYEFIDSNSLKRDEKLLSSRILLDKKTVLFLTLQDLQGDEIKDKHKEVFENQSDLLIIDETHFGARAEEYGKVLKGLGLTKTEIKKERKLDEYDFDNLDSNTIKSLDAKIKLHLSGTPYRILMNTEFTKDDIIAFYQFTNIAEDQAKWDDENLAKDDIKEWDNPYYGFPQMVRFAFNPNESSRKKMEELKSNGATYAFSELFKPYSLKKDTKNNSHKIFKHKEEILELLQVIDGSKNDDNLLSFLDYSKLKEGKMCRHIVCVLPYRASCDAFENLIITNKDIFKNLNDYKIINISGLDSEKKYKDTLSVQAKVTELEKQNHKTITLTVNRMLTGSTVPEWDTMLYFKDTASPQEYDQAVFRLQNQYIQEYKDTNGDIIKYNMKPQTLLVDFSPNRMFQMQEQKALIYNVNTEKSGNLDLESRIEKELEVSPIIILNNNKIKQIEPKDILNAVREYSSTRSVHDEAVSISVDYSLLEIEAIRAEIEKQSEIDSRQGLEIKAADGEGEELDADESLETEESRVISEKIAKEIEENTESFKKKFAMYYSRILFFAFLTDSKVKSLSEIVDSVKTDANNTRIAKNLGIELKILELFTKYINPFILTELDYKIFNINSLANDDSVEPISRAGNAMRKFSRLSDSEIVTPEHIASKIINSLPEHDINNTTKILDIASKQGEFVYAVYKKYGKEVANNFYSIPTSKIAYEFTRKVYKLLELDIDLIEAKYTSLDLIDKNNIQDNTIKINEKNMKFDVVVGNPPYQQGDGGAQASAKPIYNKFVEIAKDLSPDYISMIIPTRWYAGGKGLDSFRDDMLSDKHISELHDFLKPDLIFKDINLRGGVCYFLRDNKYDNTKRLTKVSTYRDDLTPKECMRSLKVEGADILIRHNASIEILNKVKFTNFSSFEASISARKPFGIEANIVNKNDIFRLVKNSLKEPILCYGKGKQVGYLEQEEITKNKTWTSKYKVYTPRANNIGTELNDDNLNSFIGEPNTICTESYIVVGVNLGLDKLSAKNLCKYLTTRFTRFMHSLGKASQDATSKTYKFVPLQDFTKKSDIDWSKSIEEIDKQLYKKYNLNKKEIDFIESMIKPMS